MSLRIVRAFALILLILGTAACDKIPLFAPSDSTITLSAPKRILALNESVEITAVILEKPGTPVQNGTNVRFTTTLGRVTPIEVETRNGIATVMFSAGDVSGLAEVRASSGAAGGSTAGEGATATSSNAITFTIGAAAAQSISIRANPSSVSATGGTVDVTATLIGSNGQGIASVPVTFSTDAGTLSPTSAFTDSNGNATVRLTTNVTTKVKASGGGKDSSEITVSVQGTPAVELTCLPAGAASSGATCSQVVGQPVSFTARRASSTTQIVDTTLEFGDGFTMGLGTLTNSTTVNHAYDRTGTYTATLRATDVNGQRTSASVTVNITARPPVGVNLTATPGTATTTGQPVTFTATNTGDTTALIESYTWDFGDGTTAVTSGNTTTHVYGTSSNPPPNSVAATTYTATVTVRAADGRTAVGRAEFQIKLAAP